MAAVATEVAERLTALPESAAVALRMKAADYFDVIRGMLDVFASRRQLESVYITSTVPAQTILNALRVLEIPLDRIWFIDCISQILMASAEKHPHAVFVESPTMLENLMLKVEFLLRKTAERRHLVILDSVNALSIHNNPKILSEFLHILVNNLRSRNAYTVIFTMQEYETEEIQNMMNLVCDEIVSVGGE